MTSVFLWDCLPRVQFLKLSVLPDSGYRCTVSTLPVYFISLATFFSLLKPKLSVVRIYRIFCVCVVISGCRLPRRKSSQVIQFAGITLDSVRQEARLPEDKLQKCRLLLQSFYKRRKVTLREFAVPPRSLKLYLFRYCS